MKKFFVRPIITITRLDGEDICTGDASSSFYDHFDD